MKNLKSVILAMVLLVAGASAFANGTPVNTHPGANPPGGGWGCDAENPGKSDCQPNECKGNSCTSPPPGNSGGGGGNGGTGNGGVGNGGTGTGYGGQGGTGYGGHGTADAAASAWQTMSAAQRAELTAKLTSEQRTEVMTAINSRNENKWENNSPSNASSSLTGNVTTTTIGGTAYNYSAPVAGAVVGLPTNITPPAGMAIFSTACGGDFNIEEARKILATTNVLVGLWTTTRDNGVVSTTSSTRTGLERGPWEVTGQDGDKLVQERMVNGYQAVIYAYIVNSAASSGVTLNGQNAAGALSGSGGIQTFGKEIDKFPCSFKETRRLSPVKVDATASADELAAAIAARLSLKQELSAPGYEREFVKCPAKGCTAPKEGYYRYVRKDGTVKASTELSGLSKAGTKAEVKKP